MKHYKILPLILILLFISCSSVSKNETADDRVYYYKTNKPYTRWWWFASIIKEEDIIHQLDWAKENNFGGVEIAWVYPLNRKRFAADHHDVPYMPRQEWQSEEWSEIVAFAKSYCDSIGLGCDFTFGTGWPFGDTKVPYEDATEIFDEPHSNLKKTYFTVSWEYPERGYIIDHMDKEAFYRYAERMGDALKPALKGEMSGLFVDSWEVESRYIWTKGFGKKFMESYGYDIRPVMPVIYEPEFADEHYDYMKLVADYVLNEFYIPFDKKCNELGAYSRGQCSGAPVDIISAYAVMDVPESEAMLYEPSFSKIPASAAALSSSREISSETFTCAYGFPDRREDGTTDFMKRGEEKAADLKLVADALFANGVNQIIWHGMPFNPVGADTNYFYATVHVGTTGNLSKDLKEFNAYLEKVSSFMKKGVTYSDVAVYIPLEDAWQGQAMDEPDPQMPWAWGEYEMRYVETPKELKGYHPLWINAVFLEKADYSDGKLLVGDCRFSSLYLDVDYLDIKALDVILPLAEKGLPVCVKRFPLQPGKNKSEDYDDKIKKLMSFDNVSDSFIEIAASEPLIEGKELPDFWCRKDAGSYYIFFANPCAQNLKLPLDYDIASSCKPITKNIILNTHDNSIGLTLDFTGNQSLLLVVDENDQFHWEDIVFHEVEK